MNVLDTIDMAAVHRADPSIRKCPHEPSCFVNFGEAPKTRKRKNEDHSEPLPKRRRVKAHKVKKGKTVYLDGVKGYIGKVDGNNILFCRRFGHKNQEYEEIEVPSKHSELTFDY